MNERRVTRDHWRSLRDTLRTTPSGRRSVQGPRKNPIACAALSLARCCCAASVEGTRQTQQAKNYSNNRHVLSQSIAALKSTVRESGRQVAGV